MRRGAWWPAPAGSATSRWLPTRCAPGSRPTPAQAITHLALDVPVEVIADGQDALLAGARTGSPDGLRATLLRIRDQHRDAPIDPPWDPAETRRPHLSVTADGMVAMDGLLEPVGGEALIAAIDALATPRGEGDQRSHAQRRADALGELADRVLDAGKLPSSDGGVRPHVTAVIDLDALLGHGGDARLDRSGPIASETARRIACDRGVSRVLTDAASLPLDVGRDSRTATPAQRRALRVRDRGLRFCDRPPAYADAHHIQFWGASRPHRPEESRVVMRVPPPPGPRGRLAAHRRPHQHPDLHQPRRLSPHQPRTRTPALTQSAVASCNHLRSPGHIGPPIHAASFS